MTKTNVVRGIRGAITTTENDPEHIYRATRELLLEMTVSNDIETKDIAVVIFSATPDLNSAFPARAAREMGWLEVPFLSCGNRCP